MWLIVWLIKFLSVRVISISHYYCCCFSFELGFGYGCSGGMTMVFIILGTGVNLHSLKAGA